MTFDKYHRTQINPQLARGYPIDHNLRGKYQNLGQLQVLYHGKKLGQGGDYGPPQRTVRYTPDNPNSIYPMDSNVRPDQYIYNPYSPNNESEMCFGCLPKSSDNSNFRNYSYSRCSCPWGKSQEFIRSDYFSFPPSTVAQKNVNSSQTVGLHQHWDYTLPYNVYDHFHGRNTYGLRRNSENYKDSDFENYRKLMSVNVTDLQSQKDTAR